MDRIKESFLKVKEDMQEIQSEILALKNAMIKSNSELVETRQKMIEICDVLTNINSKIHSLEQNSTKNINLTEELSKQKLQTDNSTYSNPNTTQSFSSSTHMAPFKPQKPYFLAFSTGNEGAPTDRQTDRQTDQQTQKQGEISFKEDSNSIDDAVKILESLDSIKKELRIKFKRLTDQEFLVFSTIYQIEEQKGHTDYKELSNKLSLTESSIRDYVGRLIKKGVSVDKTKINNKNIQLKISKNLKKIASLNTILQLRGI